MDQTRVFTLTPPRQDHASRPMYIKSKNVQEHKRWTKEFALSTSKLLTEKLQTVFSKYDADHSGQVDSCEMQGVLTVLGIEMGPV